MSWYGLILVAVGQAHFALFISYTVVKAVKQHKGVGKNDVKGCTIKQVYKKSVRQMFFNICIRLAEIFV